MYCLSLSCKFINRGEYGGITPSKVRTGMKRRPGIRTGRLKRNTEELSKWETEGRVVSVSPETHRIDQTFCPHSGQNFAPGERVASHLEHLPGVLRLAPHSGQNLALVDRWITTLGTRSNYGFSPV